MLVYTEIVNQGVMINFVCQLDWAIGCLDIWSNVIRSVSVRDFWMKLTFELVDKKADCPPLGGWVSFSLLKS